MGSEFYGGDCQITTKYVHVRCDDVWIDDQGDYGDGWG
jgi:hypothetical protein